MGYNSGRTGDATKTLLNQVESNALKMGPLATTSAPETTPAIGEDVLILGASDSNTMVKNIIEGMANQEGIVTFDNLGRPKIKAGILPRFEVTGSTNMPGFYSSKGLKANQAFIVNRVDRSISVLCSIDYNSISGVLYFTLVDLSSLNIYKSGALSGATASAITFETAMSNTYLIKYVPQVNTANKVYGTDANGDQTTYDASSFGQVDDVQVDGVSVVTNKIATISLTDYAKKVGPLPSYSVNSTDNVLSFVVNNNVNGKAIVLYIDGVPYIGRFNRFGNEESVRYSFVLKGVGSTTIFYTGNRTDMENMIFTGLITGDTYKHEYETIDNKVTSISAESTDQQYPSAKCVFDEAQNVREVAEGKCKTFILSYQDTVASVKEALSTYQGKKIYDADGNDITEAWLNGDYDEVVVGNSNFNSNDEVIYAFVPPRGIIFKTNASVGIGSNFIYYSYSNYDLLNYGDVILVAEKDVPNRWKADGYWFYNLKQPSFAGTGIYIEE